MWLVALRTRRMSFMWLNSMLQTAPGTSIEGPVIDRFVESGKGYQYLSKRNYFGAGKTMC